MIYTRKQFGSDLLTRLSETSDPVSLARWAYSLYFAHLRDLEAGIKPEIMKVVAMEEGPEFEMTQEELRQWAKSLIEAPTVE